MLPFSTILEVRSHVYPFDPYNGRHLIPPQGLLSHKFWKRNNSSMSFNVFGLWLLKHWKIRVALRQWCSNFPWRERKPNYVNKNRKLRIRPLVKSFLAAENEKRQLEDLPRVDFGHLHERFLLLVRTKSITENLYIKITSFFFLQGYNECLLLSGPTYCMIF